MATDKSGRGEQTLSPTTTSESTGTGRRGGRRESLREQTSRRYQDTEQTPGATGSSAKAAPGDPAPGIPATALGGGFGHEDNTGVHPLTGKSLDYVRGAGFESYPDDQYDSDQVNTADHFNR